jgi:hypothetical protein
VVEASDPLLKLPVAAAVLDPTFLKAGACALLARIPRVIAKSADHGYSPGYTAHDDHSRR